MSTLKALIAFSLFPNENTYAALCNHSKVSKSCDGIDNRSKEKETEQIYQKPDIKAVDVPFDLTLLCGKGKSVCDSV